jgi:hypothetical protein
VREADVIRSNEGNSRIRHWPGEALADHPTISGVPGVVCKVLRGRRLYSASLPSSADWWEIYTLASSGRCAVAESLNLNITRVQFKLRKVAGSALSQRRL